MNHVCKCVDIYVCMYMCMGASDFLRHAVRRDFDLILMKLGKILNTANRAV